LAAGTASMVWVYDGADYTTFILQKTRFCAGYMRVPVIRVCGVYARKYGNYVRSQPLTQNVNVVFLADHEIVYYLSSALQLHIEAR